MNPNKRDLSKMGKAGKSINLRDHKPEPVQHGFFTYDESTNARSMLVEPDERITCILPDGEIIHLQIQHGELKVSKSPNDAKGGSARSHAISITPHSSNVFMVK